MKMKPILSIPALVFLMLTYSPAATQPMNSYPLWNGIESGEYSVGFKVINHWDRSRNRDAKYDEEGTLNNERFFPVQISVWYPAAEKWTEDSAMPFIEYFYITESKNDFSIPSDERKAQALDIFFNFTNHAGVERTREELAEIGLEPTAVIYEASPAEGKFPVIISGHDGGVWKNTTLNEYLASHGYVIISTGPLSETSSMIFGNPQAAIQRRIRTFEMIRGMLPSIEGADEHTIGLLGLNSDGMSAMLYQMKNVEADVLVNIDGWEGKNNGNGYVSSSPYFDAQNFTIPFMEFHQHEETDRESLQLNQTIFQALNSPEKQSYVLTGFGHAFLTGNTIAVPGLDDGITEKYEFMFHSILGFFNQYLKGGKILYEKSDKPDSFFQRAEIISEN
jgi:hypothetical protein